MFRKIRLPIDEINNLYQEGQSTAAIGKIFGVSKTYVRKRLRVEGIPRRSKGGKRPYTEQERIKRFWSCVNKNGPIPTHCPEIGNCWIWEATLNKGYGIFWNGTELIGAHRFSYELEYTTPVRDRDAELFGDAPLQLLHACDNPPCVRPTHLSRGTTQDNTADKVAKNRTARGEKAGPAKLTWEKVSEIRSLYETGEWPQKKLAEKFAIRQNTVSQIVSKKTWRAAKIIRSGHP